MLSVETVVPYLLERGLLDDRLVADTDLQVVDVSRRNHNFKLLCEAGPGYFLKQGRDTDTAGTVAHEARLYQWFAAHPDATTLAELVPQCRLYDSAQRTLVMELIPKAESLFQHQWRTRRVAADIGTALGQALGTLHALTRSAASDGRDDDAAPGHAARFLLLHRPGIETLATASSASLELISVVQQSHELAAVLDRLDQEWRPACLIHGDLRWDNCQVVHRTAGGGPRVQFVDWEMAGLGDPRWDVGTVFSDCLSAWLLSAPVTANTAPAEFLSLARHPLRAMQPAMRAFWRAYVRRMELDRATATDWLARCVQYAGARLVQAAYEDMRGAARLAASVVYMLQLSANVVERPLEAAGVLLGIAEPLPPSP